MEENRRLRAAASRKTAKADGDASDDEGATDREALAMYTATRDQLMEALRARRAPTAAQYEERNLYMHRLSDADLQAEYQWYTQLYLADETGAGVRGMAEMTLIKLGELVDKPQVQSRSSHVAFA